jgi:hypothetical protein
MVDHSFQQLFREGRIVRITDFASPEISQQLVHRALRLVDSRGLKRDGYPSRGGRSLHEILDGFVVQECFPELLDLYSKARGLAEQIVEKPVLLSPHVRSGVNIRVYRYADSEDGWHYDTNPLSALLYLTEGGEPTQFRMPDETLLNIYPSPGLLTLFNGRNLLHHVPRGGQLRITCPFNLYYPDDITRPDYIDKVLFENSDRARQ